ncbi:type II CAAX endopeptidase family protein [Hyphomicrobium sp.]|uniref:CPBP family intramembrane glutamic endopeptidase n=1 Tax=Hyphomicrobium sp. TaxID=82 RepID=UPI0025C27E34|nr:type II CAAX endopeptidase family protein [Hyphomicrobium sp.]MCC7251771.1 CPBP family intramembrane metalloprotease [Hyphomicrobium sp.]
MSVTHEDTSRAASRPETPWTPGAAVGITLAAALAPMLIGLLAVLAENAGLINVPTQPDGGIPSLASPSILAQMIVGQLLSLAIVWVAAGWKGARPQVLRLAPPQTGWAQAVGYGVLLIVLIGPIEILLYRLADIALFTDGRWILEGLRSPYWWAVILAAVVLAPLWEEVSFRGFLLSALAKSRLGFWPAAVLSSGLWTLLHVGYSWPGLASVFLAGMGMSWIMLRTGSMRAVVVAHGVINAFSLTVISLFGPVS